eukprot:m.174021 g.174021  ORF g.174021 m.174021 type:complete len:454 (-) comp14589_c2_seq3:124-1485(-)
MSLGRKGKAVYVDEGDAETVDSLRLKLIALRDDNEVYVRRFRDVVATCKGLLKEKTALENTVKALASASSATPSAGSGVQSGDDQVEDPLATPSQIQAQSDASNGEEGSAQKSGSTLLEDQLRTLKETIATLTEEKTANTQRFQNDKKVVVEQHRAQIQSLKEKLAESETIQHQLQEQYEILSQQHESARTPEAKLAKELDTQKRRVAMLETELLTVAAQRDKAVEAAASAEQSVDKRVQRALKQEKAGIALSSNERERLEQKIVDMSQLIGTYEQARREQQRRLHTIELANSAMTEEAQQLRSDQLRLQEQNKQLTQQLSAVTQSVESCQGLKQANAALQRKTVELQSQLEMLKRKDGTHVTDSSIGVIVTPSSGSEQSSSESVLSRQSHAPRRDPQHEAETTPLHTFNGLESPRPPCPNCARHQAQLDAAKQTTAALKARSVVPASVSVYI